MTVRVAITFAAWLTALFFLTSDGQQFAHAIALLLAAVLGALPWVSLVRRGHSARHRVVAIAVLFASAVIAISVASQLPRAYEAQQEFNARSTLQPAL